jgi:hypothetical protein
VNKRAGFKAFVVAAGAASMILAGTSVATAAPAAPTAFLTCMKVVDSGTSIDLTRWVRVQNKCAWTYTVKVVWKAAPDSTCNTLSPGEKMKSVAPIVASYDGTAIC